jgi:hypothetical protein
MTTTAIQHSELRSAIEWYFESKNLAIKNALKLRCPLSTEQQKELRQYYSEYFVALVSAIELLRESSYEFNVQFNEQLIEVLSFEPFSDGKENYDYIRELRNSVVHRGLDLCSAVHVCEEHFLVVAPIKVFDRNGKKSFSAFGYYLLEIIAKCEEAIGPFIAKHLQEVGLLKPLLTQDQASEEAGKYLLEAQAVPDWVKTNALNLISQIDFLQTQALAVEKLVSLLNLNALIVVNDSHPIISSTAAQ